MQSTGIHLISIEILQSELSINILNFLTTCVVCLYDASKNIWMLKGICGTVAIPSGSSVALRLASLEPVYIHKRAG